MIAEYRLTKVFKEQNIIKYSNIVEPYGTRQEHNKREDGWHYENCLLPYLATVENYLPCQDGGCSKEDDKQRECVAAISIRHWAHYQRILNEQPTVAFVASGYVCHEQSRNADDIHPQSYWRFAPPQHGHASRHQNSDVTDVAENTRLKATECRHCSNPEDYARHQSQFGQYAKHEMRNQRGDVTCCRAASCQGCKKSVIAVARLHLPYAKGGNCQTAHSHQNGLHHVGKMRLNQATEQNQRKDNERRACHWDNQLANLRLQ